jgi:hypothetical protein
MRKFIILYSRSVFTLTDQPSDGETVTIGSDVYTFRTTPSLTHEVEIGETILTTLANLAAAIDSDYVAGTALPDPDVFSVTIYFTQDGVTTSTDVANGSFDVASSTGYSGKGQSLQFPRAYLYDADGVEIYYIPENLKKATCEYAYRANSTTLDPDPTFDASGLRKTGYRKKVGPLETEWKYAEEQTPVIIKDYPAADRLLQEYVNSVCGTIRA